MVSPIPKVNILQQEQQVQQMQAIQPTAAVGRKSPESFGGSANNPFASQLYAGETVGLSNMQPGDVVNTPAQAGKPAGMSKLLYNA